MSPIKIGTKVIENFDKDFMKKEIKEKWGLFDSLSREEQQSLFEFALMICGDDKVDYFVTPSEILLDNKDDIYNNTGIHMITLEEMFKIASAEQEGTHIFHTTKRDK